MAHTVDPFGRLRAAPPGAAVFARIRVHSRWQTVCLVHEGSARIARLGDCPLVEFRVRALERDGVLLVLMLVKIGPRLYVTWANYCEAGVGDTTIRDLSEQREIIVRMHGPSGELQRLLSTSNRFQRWFGDLDERLEAAPPWTPEEFDAASDAVCQVWPTVRELWRAARPAKAKCKICRGAVLAPRRRYCSDVCVKNGHNRGRRVKRRRRRCRRCGKWFPATRRGHKVCGAACRQAEVRERERASNRDPVIAAWAAQFRQDARDLGLEVPLPKGLAQDADAVDQREEKRTIDEFLRSAGIDPRPARKDGKALRSPPADG